MVKFRKALSVCLSVLLLLSSAILPAYAENVAPDSNISSETPQMLSGSGENTSNYQIGSDTHDILLMGDNGSKDAPVYTITDDTQYTTVMNADGSTSMRLLSAGGVSLMDGSDTANLDVLDPPTNLAWSGTTPGNITFTAANGITRYKVVVYKDSEAFYSSNYSVSLSSGNSIEFDFSVCIKDSGTYYFTVQSIQEDNYSVLTGESNIVTSDSFVYIRPSAVLGTPSNLRWNGDYATWSAVEGTNKYEVQWYKLGDSNEWIDWGRTWGEFNDCSVKCDDTGTMAFTVRACSCDITAAANGTESAMSDSATLNGNTGEETVLTTDTPREFDAIAYNYYYYSFTPRDSATYTFSATCNSGNLVLLDSQGNGLTSAYPDSGGTMSLSYYLTGNVTYHYKLYPYTGGRVTIDLTQCPAVTEFKAATGPAIAAASGHEADISVSYEAPLGSNIRVGVDFGYSPSDFFSYYDQPQSAYSETGTVYLRLMPLKAETTYYYRAYIYDGDNRAYYYGDTLTFTTGKSSSLSLDNGHIDISEENANCTDYYFTYKPQFDGLYSLSLSISGYIKLCDNNMNDITSASGNDGSFSMEAFLKAGITYNIIIYSYQDGGFTVSAGSYTPEELAPNGTTTLEAESYNSYYYSFSPTADGSYTLTSACSGSLSLYSESGTLLATVFSYNGSLSFINKLRGGEKYYYCLCPDVSGNIPIAITSSGSGSDSYEITASPCSVGVSGHNADISVTYNAPVGSSFRLDIEYGITQSNLDGWSYKSIQSVVTEPETQVISISDLKANTTYYYRVLLYVQNTSTSYYGETLSFTTGNSADVPLVSGTAQESSPVPNSYYFYTFTAVTGGLYDISLSAPAEINIYDSDMNAMGAGRDDWHDFSFKAYLKAGEIYYICVCPFTDTGYVLSAVSYNPPNLSLNKGTAFSAQGYTDYYFTFTPSINRTYYITAKFTYGMLDLQNSEGTNLIEYYPDSNGYIKFEFSFTGGNTYFIRLNSSSSENVSLLVSDTDTPPVTDFTATTGAAVPGYSGFGADIGMSYTAPAGSNIEAGVIYGTDQANMLNYIPASSGTSDTLTATLWPLKPATLYYYRAYISDITNSNIYYGDIKSFTTGSAEPVFLNSNPVQTDTSAVRPVYSYTVQSGGFYKISLSQAGIITVYDLNMNLMFKVPETRLFETYTNSMSTFYYTVDMNPPADYTISAEPFTPSAIPAEGLTLPAEAGTCYFYKFEPPASGIYKFNIIGSYVNSIIYDSNMINVGSKFEYSPSGTSVTAPLFNGKVYYISIYAYMNASLSVSAAKADAAPLNGTASVQTVKDAWQYLSYTPAKDGFYGINVSTADSAATTASSSDLCLYTDVLDSNGSNVSSGSKNAQSVTIYPYLHGGAIYYVGFKPYSAGTYNVTAFAPYALTSDTLTVVNADGNTNYMYSFTPDSDGSYNFSINCGSGFAELYDSGGNQLSMQYADGSNITLPYTLTGNHTYYYKLYPYTGGSYAVSIGGLFKAATGEAVNITGRTAVIQFAYTAPVGSNLRYGIYYGENADNLEKCTYLDTLTPTTSGYFSTTVTLVPLKDQTKYYYKAFVYDKGTDKYYYGQVKYFTTVASVDVSIPFTESSPAENTYYVYTYAPQYDGFYEITSSNQGGIYIFDNNLDWNSYSVFGGNVRTYLKKDVKYFVAVYSGASAAFTVSAAPYTPPSLNIGNETLNMGFFATECRKFNPVKSGYYEITLSFVMNQGTSGTMPDYTLKDASGSILDTLQDNNGYVKCTRWFEAGTDYYLCLNSYAPGTVSITAAVPEAIADVGEKLLSLSAAGEYYCSFTPLAGGEYTLSASSYSGDVTVYNEDGSVLGSKTASNGAAELTYDFIAGMTYYIRLTPSASCYACLKIIAGGLYFGPMLNLGGSINAAMYDSSGKMLKIVKLDSQMLAYSDIPSSTAYCTFFCLNNESKPLCNSVKHGFID